MRTGTVAGVDGGGTHSTVALAGADGREILRRRGPAGLVDPRDPAATARMIARLVGEAATEAGLAVLPDALCAGLAGVGNGAERRA
ncbi:MAG: hypothetical protein M3409_11645, partial [Gemmatimonadota bacterium]|nr:hypothetical protein [Gemmatimonadota bacterium]